MQELIIDGSQGSYQIGVHPDIVTFIYIPGKVERIFSSAGENRFTTEVMGSRLIVRPLDSQRVEQAVGSDSSDSSVGAAANIHIETESFVLTLLLRVVSDPARATSVVLFTPRSETEEARAKATEERIAERVREQVAAERIELARLRQALLHNRDVFVRGEVARGILARRDTQRFDYRERNDDNIILWLKSGVWVGSDLYLHFDLQNRSSEEFAFSSVQAQQSYRSGGRVIRELIDTQLVMDGVPSQGSAGGERSVSVEPGAGAGSGQGGARGSGAEPAALRRSEPAPRAGSLARAATWMGGAWIGDPWFALTIGPVADAASTPTVGPGTRRQGVLCIPDAEFLRDDQLILIVEAVEHEQSIELSGISWR